MLSGIGRRNVDILWTIKHLLLLGWFLYIIFELINETQCSSEPNRNIISAKIKKTKLHLTQKTGLKSGVQKLLSSDSNWLSRSTKTDPQSLLLYSLNSKVNKINTNLEKFIQALQPLKNSECNRSEILNNSLAQINFTLNDKSISKSAENSNEDTELELIPNQNFEETPENLDKEEHPSEDIIFSQNNMFDADSSNKFITNLTETTPPFVESYTELNFSRQNKSSDENKEISTSVINLNPLGQSEIKTQTEIQPPNKTNDEQDSIFNIVENVTNVSSTSNKLKQLNLVKSSELEYENLSGARYFDTTVAVTDDRNKSKSQPRATEESDLNHENEIPQNLVGKTSPSSSQISMTESPVTTESLVDLKKSSILDNTETSNSMNMINNSSILNESLHDDIDTGTERVDFSTPPRNYNSNDSETPIPNTMAGVPGLDGSYGDDDDNFEQKSTNSSDPVKIIQDVMNIFSTQPDKNSSTEQSVSLEQSNKTRKESSNIPNYNQQESNQTFIQEEESRNNVSNSESLPINPNRSSSPFISLDPKPYTWKRICLQGVDKIHFSLDEHVIRLPENKADMYLFYYIPDLMHLNRSGNSLYLPNEHTKHYKGGYLKHRYTSDKTEGRSDDFTAYSLHHQKVIHSLSKSKPKHQMKSDVKPSTKIVHPELSQKSTVKSADQNIIAADKKATIDNSSPYCFLLPYFPSNHTFGNFQISHAVSPSAEAQKNGTVRATREEPRNQNLGNDKRPKREIYLDSFDSDPIVESDCFGDVKWCADRSKCIPNRKWCDQIIDCSDKSDEMNCTCRERMDAEKVCDHYFDCPDGEDERGCFGCPENTFSCDYSIRKSSNVTCIRLNQRCDGRSDCFDETDEMDCELLADTIDSHETFQTSYISGYLHRNWQGKWYPACIETHSEHFWGVQACRSELGVNVKHVEAELLPFHSAYYGKFITHLETKEIAFVDTCKYPGYAVHVKCPSLPCGNRIPQKYFSRRYHSKRQTRKDFNDDEAIIKVLKLILGKSNIESIRKRRDENAKVVGGTDSQPGYWPWLAALYKNGEFHCGGAIIDETWILTAGHCVHEYVHHYFEIYAGTLRRYSFSPSEQIRMVTHVIIHPEYSHSDLKNDLALLKLDEPLKFNRWVRPICLPADRPPWGPVPGTYCTAIGWGLTQEKGPRHPDNMQEVQIPVKARCKEEADQEGEEICAGYERGGRDTCQGDSGGPFLCSLPRAHDQWYIAGVVSHGEGCARPHEPGAYTRVALFMPWIITYTDNKFLTSARKSSHECPGIKCLHGGRCVGLKRICDLNVNCLSAEDEINCPLSMPQPDDNDNKFDGGPAKSLAKYKESVMKLKSNITELSASVETSNNSSHLPSINNFQLMSQVKESLSGVRSVLSNSEIGSVSMKNDELIIEKRETSLYFTCLHLPQNIPLTSYCDTEVDCEDGTDEINCTCADYLKVTNKSLICDGIIHCYDLSDENYCPDYNCTNNEFFCFKSRTCILKQFLCDGRTHCPRGEDEHTCYWPIPIATGTVIQKQFDMFGVPLFADKGILAHNDRGVWKWLCFPQENEVDVPKTVHKLAKRLRFKNYKSYDHLMVFDDEVLNRKGENYCSGLSVDFAVAHVEDESLIPWRASIFVNGIFKCLGVLIEGEWVLTDVSCCLQLNTSTDYIVAVFGIDEKLSGKIRTFEEQIIPVNKIQCDQQAYTTLMHLNERPRTTKKTKSLRMPSTRETRKIYKYYLLILEDTQSYSFELKLISNCSFPSSCYKITKNIDFCLNSNSSRQFVGVVSLSKKNEWIFSGGVVKSLGCLINETVVTINLQPSSLQENVFVNITEFFYRGHYGYRCILGNQISWDDVCDGKTDCRENEDETNTLCQEKEILILGEFIERSCKVNELKCKNGRCVLKSAICNSINDCGDNTDEPETCSNFNCAVYLNLTNPQKLCDSQQDCLDKSDEDVETCSLCDFPSSFTCNKSNSCIPLDFVCDGERDCEFGEDEKECISYNVSLHNQTEGTIWMRSNGKWNQECFTTSELVAFDAQHLCQQFGYDQAIKVRSIPAKKHIYTSFIQVKLNDFFEVTLKRNAEKELISTEHCHHLHLSCSKS